MAERMLAAPDVNVLGAAEHSSVARLTFYRLLERASSAEAAIENEA